MLQIKQFRYNADNLTYVLYGHTEACVIDGGAVEDILGFLKTRRLALNFITNTHSHHDHTSGNSRLAKETGARCLSFADLPDGRGLDLEGDAILVLRTPGHSEDSVCFYAAPYLISGDTLFNGTVGNCFSGDLRGFYHSIKKLTALPEETIVYAGHDYVKDSMTYASILDPRNKAIQEFLAAYSPEHVFSTLKNELQMNPFLRLNEPGIADFIKRQGLPCATEWERWESLMRME